MKHTKNYMDAMWVVENHEKYDNRDVVIANSFIQAYNEGYNQALSLGAVVGQSEQFYCTCSRAKGLDHDEDGMPYCIECQKPVQ